MSQRLTSEQHEILLKGINGSRVARRKGGGGMSLSYLETWDVKAHLTRIFGFCNWSATVEKSELAFEEQNEKKQWNVGYLVSLRLVLNDERGRFLCEYEEAAVGSATLPSRGEAHDMAVKTAESDALKRCAINLGDQFGLSLYNQGSTTPVVRMTLVRPDTPSDAQEAPSQAPKPLGGSETQAQVAKAPKARVAELSKIADITDAEKRILAIASFKAKNPDILDYIADANGVVMTIGRYADLIAAGQYTENT